MMSSLRVHSVLPTKDAWLGNPRELWLRQATFWFAWRPTRSKSIRYSSVKRQGLSKVCIFGRKTRGSVGSDGCSWPETDSSPALPTSATILICSTVSPAFHEALPSRIAEAGRPDVTVIDCPVSGGTTRAANGTLTIFASGETAALARAQGLLRDMSEKLYTIPGGVGAASKVKMVNQLLVGTHIAAAAEAMALASKAGLNTGEVFKIITNAAGNSWAFENRVPHMLKGDWTPHSALDIFVKDMVC